MRIGSLFAGIGGLELGLERAGLGEVVWQVEIDPFCRAVLAKHWPNAQRFEDVREVHRGILDSVDLVCGGFPCQDVSAAGKRAGIGGERTGLWAEYRRIVEELAPRWVVVENVTELRRAGLEVVLRDLAALGFDAEWTTVGGTDVGAPHTRPRIFVVAHRCNDRCEGFAPRDCAEGALDVQPGGDAHRCCLDRVRDGLRSAVESGMARDLHGVRHRVDCDLPPDCLCDEPVFPARRGEVPHEGEHPRTLKSRDEYGYGKRHRIHALGNAVIPQCAELVGRAIAATIYY